MTCLLVYCCAQQIVENFNEGLVSLYGSYIDIDTMKYAWPTSVVPQYSMCFMYCDSVLLHYWYKQPNLQFTVCNRSTFIYFLYLFLKYQLYWRAGLTSLPFFSWPKGGLDIHICMQMWPNLSICDNRNTNGHPWV